MDLLNEHDDDDELLIEQELNMELQDDNEERS